MVKYCVSIFYFISLYILWNITFTECVWTATFRETKWACGGDIRRSGCVCCAHAHGANKIGGIFKKILNAILEILSFVLWTQVGSDLAWECAWIRRPNERGLLNGSPIDNYIKNTLSLHSNGVLSKFSKKY